ncbi:kinase-like domain-containing protein [Hypoxylon cercidicola]|nr:kinase-like domain-containing protein [Hypoxylon cercidicola]
MDQITSSWESSLRGSGSSGGSDGSTTSTERAAQKLKQFFSLDPYWVYKKPLGQGRFGSAHFVQHIQNINGVTHTADLVIKVAKSNEEAIEELQEEKRHLRALEGGMHIVRMFDIPNNPLQMHGFDQEWLILEWIPNGMLFDFITKARVKGLTRIPNRLLWRFFLCLVRAACGMAWPRNRHDGIAETEFPMQGVEPSGYSHNDLHSGNVVLGDFLADGDHVITPILKLIDFGLAGSDFPIKDSTLNNLGETGLLMCQLITLNVELELDNDHIEIDNLGKKFYTRAAPILPSGNGKPRPFPWLDDRLAFLIALCMPAQESEPPTLQELTSHLQYAIRERDAAFYGDPIESDAAVHEYCRRVMFDAET